MNRHEDLLLERVFVPAPDLEEKLRRHHLALFALESGLPLTSFDIIGFTLQYELSYTNILNMLDLAQIPFFSKKRDETFPLIIGGGPGACNPEPLADFFDLFVLGEAEEALPHLLKELARLRSAGLCRAEILKNLALLEGVYVPAYFKPQYSKTGLLEALKYQGPSGRQIVTRQKVKLLNDAPYLVAPIVPYIKTIHDRAVVELFRGCARGCRFCQAGFIFRPVRRRRPQKIIDLGVKQLAFTGYDEISLSSLSSSDYPQLALLIKDLKQAVGDDQVKINLPSLRLDSYSVGLAQQLNLGKRKSLTFAPEAATERLREVINKNIEEKDIFNALDSAIEAGWQGFKLYFMIGLPTETDRDVEEIVTLCRNIYRRYKKQASGFFKLAVSVATFIPKAHTPFQYEPQLALPEIKRRQQILIDGFKKIRGIDFSWHEAEASYLEAVFARGDRRLAALLEKAFQLGCRFDGWSDHFNFALWEEAFIKTGLDGSFYAGRRFAYSDLLPWEHLHCGIDREIFIKEHKAVQNMNIDGSIALDPH